MSDEERLIEEVAGAHRPPSRDVLRYHPAWHDLDEAGRAKAFDLAKAMRALEAATSPDGLSMTARAVLAKIR